MNKKITICSNTSWYIYNFRKGLIKAVQNQGYRVSIIAPYDEYSEKLEELGCEYYDIEMNNKGTNLIEDIKLMYQYYYLFKKINPDMLLIYTIKPNIYASLIAKILNIKTINVIAGLGTVFLDDNPSSKFARWLYKIALFNNKVIFENEDDSEEFIRRDIIRKRQATVIPGSGIDTKAFKHRYGISKSKNITFLLIARLIKDKGVVEYVEAVKAIRYKYPDARFKILGSFYFDNPSAISKDEVNSWVESGTIEYLGYTDNVLDEIEKVDCIVLPSYREGLSRVLLEAGSMSKPIITTNVTGCKEVVDDGYNGFLVKPKDSISLAIAMEKMINLSYRERVQMGIRGRLKVINEFDDKIVIKKYMDTILSSEEERLILSRA